jgi:hypothetical protein
VQAVAAEKISKRLVLRVVQKVTPDSLMAKLTDLRICIRLEETNTTYPSMCANIFIQFSLFVTTET